MDCPNCKQSIEDDAYFCDQCGAEILLCTFCKRPGKSKRCVSDGAELVPARTIAANPAPSTTSATPPGTPSGSATSRLDPTQAPRTRLRLLCTAQGLDLAIDQDTLLGRSQGPYAGQLGRFSKISGRHLEIRCLPTGWAAVDIGSTNGSRYNSTPLEKQQIQALASGDTLTLADVPFQIRIETC